MTGIFANAEDPNEIDNLEAVRVTIQSVDPEKAILVHSVSPSSTGGGVTFVPPSPANSVFFDIHGGSLGAALTSMDISVIPEPGTGLITLLLSLISLLSIRGRRGLDRGMT